MEATEFRRRLDAALEDAPPVTRPEADLVAGKNRLRRRRITVLAAALAAAVMLGVPLAVLGTRDPDVGPAPGAPSTSGPTSQEPYPGWRWESYRGVEFQVPKEWDRAAASSWCIGLATPEDGVPRVSLPGMPVRLIGCMPENGYGVSVEGEGGLLQHPDGSPWKYPAGGGAYPDGAWMATVPAGDQVVTIRTPARELTQRIASTVGTTGEEGALPVLVVGQPGDVVGAEASVGGMLAVSHAGCVVFDDRVFVAPAGSSVADDGRSVTLAGWGTYRLGDQVRVSGAPAIRDRLDDVPATARQCFTGEEEGFELVYLNTFGD